LADTCIDRCARELRDLAQGDRDVLVAASEIVRKRRADSPERRRYTEHFAFTLLSAVFTDSVE
jgi:hypothetical protein